MKTTRVGLRVCAAVALASAIPLTLADGNAAPPHAADARGPAGKPPVSPWKLVSAETFGSLDAVARVRWVRDPHG